MIKKKCANCGKEFEARTELIVYCSIPCRREGLKQKRKQANKKYYETTMGRMVK